MSPCHDGGKILVSRGPVLIWFRLREIRGTECSEDCETHTAMAGLHAESDAGRAARPTATRWRTSVSPPRRSTSASPDLMFTGLLVLPTVRMGSDVWDVRLQD